MVRQNNIRRVILFALRLAIIAPAVLVIWGLCLPAYAWFIGQCASMVLNIFGHGIERVVVDAEGLLNSKTKMGFVLGERMPTTPIALVVSNIATFVALVLATRRLGWRDRGWAVALGVAVLAASHVTHVVVFFAFAKGIQQHPQVPTAIAQIFISLPFLLWIALVFLGSYGNDGTDGIHERDGKGA
ncbi:MAG: hypothetical protein SGI88_17755 [Candidatus Hydrogenedentes bacterium]|nr:hypothetical protein [Candidatus Hydrogenedentota bacterium]